MQAWDKTRWAALEREMTIEPNLKRADLLGVEEAFFTPVEDLLRGATTDDLELIGTLRGNEYHIPHAILSGNCSPDIVKMGRKILGYWIAKGSTLGLTEELFDAQIAISYEELDPETNIAVKDPEILGLYDREHDEVHKVEGRDLNKEVYTAIRDRKIDHPEDEISVWDHLRDAKSYVPEAENRETNLPSENKG